ncbi:MAG: hypothetical protein ACFFDN_16470 [Candidatus Hodarchaeota archaeon]
MNLEEIEAKVNLCLEIIKYFLDKLSESEKEALQESFSEDYLVELLEEILEE